MSIRKKLIISSLWSITATSASMFSGFVVFSILARLLQPAEFGIVAFAAIFVELARAFMKAGIPEALIQRPSWDDTAASTAFWANIASSTLFAIVMSAAGALMILFDSPVLGTVFVVLSGGLVIDGARAVHEAKLQREFGYKVLALRSVSANLAAGTLGIIMALQGFGVWALVAHRLTFTTMNTFVIWHSLSWRPHFLFSLDELRQLSRVGGSLLLARTLGEISKRIPELAIGLILGPSALAIYRVGSRGLEFLTQVTVTPLKSTALSALSRLPGAAVGEAYVRMTSATATVTFPAFLGSAAIAPDFVMFCFGEKWASSASVMTVLALAVVPSTLLYFAAPALAAVGKPRLIVISDLAQLIANFLITLATVPFGVVAASAGLTVRAHLTSPVSLLMLREGVGLPIARTIRSLIGPAMAASLMAASVTAARIFLLNDMPPLLRLLACAALGAVVYTVLLFALAPHTTSRTLQEFLPYLSPKLKKIGLFLARLL